MGGAEKAPVQTPKPHPSHHPKGPRVFFSLTTKEPEALTERVLRLFWEPTGHPVCFPQPIAQSRQSQEGWSSPPALPHLPQDSNARLAHLPLCPQVPGPLSLEHLPHAGVLWKASLSGYTADCSLVYFLHLFQRQKKIPTKPPKLGSTPSLVAVQSWTICFLRQLSHSLLA